jgi:glycosyltransferase involved in cell wall biosynthesis
MTKNILFYIPTINQKEGGVRQYAFNILKTFSENYSEDFTFYIYHKRKDQLFLDIVKENKNFALIQTHLSAKIVIKFQVILHKIIHFLTFKSTKLSLNFLDFLIKKHKIDIIHCPYQYIPKTKLAKLISTMHDVQELHFPEFFTAETLESRAKNYADFIKRSDAVVVSFNHVKEDLIRFFNADKNKIHTLLIGINNLWVTDYFNKETNFEPNFDFDSFLLYPANSWKHKNHLGLIEALRILKGQNKIVYLVFTGDFNNENGTFLISKIKEYGLENQIRLKGIVNQEELYGLYLKSTGVVVPTLYEAGSYPLYESIFIEKPVVCSNVTSLPETIGNDKFVFHPNDYDDMADKIEKLYFDEAYRIESIFNSKKRKNDLKSNDAVKILYNLYHAL